MSVQHEDAYLQTSVPVPSLQLSLAMNLSEPLCGHLGGPCRHQQI